MNIIQRAYDATFVAAPCKKANLENCLKMKKLKAKIMNEDVASVQRKRHAAALKASDGTTPPKKRCTLKKYQPIDTPGQTKLTTFVTPGINSNAKTPSSVPTSVPIEKVKTSPFTLENFDSTTSFKSPEPFTIPQVTTPQASIPISVSGNSDLESISTVETQMLPSMLACCRGVCNGCMLQFHQCHENK